jgi:hypothetical protein
MASQSLTWEVSEAIRLVPRNKIMIIHGEESDPPHCAYLPCIKYSISRVGLKAAQSSFKKWLLNHIYSADLPNGQHQFPESPQKEDLTGEQTL